MPYIVYLGSHSFGPSPSAVDAESATNFHYNLLGSYVGSTEKAKEAIFYSYNRYINGFAAVLDEDEAAKIAKDPNVVSVFLSEKRKLHTTQSWNFLGLGRNGAFPQDSIWQKTLGEDIIIGNIDTGVWPESKSFRDEGLGPVPKRWRGICQINDKSEDKFQCNRKLIGARYLYKGYEAGGDKLNASEITARDYAGHGSHTLSTAGGNFVPGVSAFGFGNGTASGGSPKARVVAYRVCWTYCADADILAAFEAAIGDGVDILSFSLGGDTPAEYFQSGTSIGSFHAVANGIFVASSAGNSGPSPSTVINGEPWVLTVAASTIDRNFPNYVTLGDKTILKGGSHSEHGLPSQNLYPLISGADAKLDHATAEDALLCQNGTLDPEKVKGKIVVCVRGDNTRTDKAVQAAHAGAVGVVLANDKKSGNQVQADPYVLPTSLISFENGTYVFNYIKSTKNPVASISSVTTESGVKPAPVVGAFSSRGPDAIEPTILKPDITAPGISIIAAYSEDASPSEEPSDTRTTPFIVMSGTSMSSPHAAGVAGLIKAVHPDWSPAAIKSAILTSATTTDNTGRPILDSLMNDEATPFAYGAGHIQPNLALEPGLPYIVYLGSHSFGSSPSAADLESVRNSHYNLLGSYVGSIEKAKESIFYSYNRNINGFAAILDEDEAARIAKHPNVLSVFVSKRRKLHTTHSWDFLGLKRNGVFSLDSLRQQKEVLGEDVIIGNLDTGVWPESKSFSDEGLGPIPKRWRGICQTNRQNQDKFQCNRKLIGARYFYKGYEEGGSPLNASLITARDFEGHGSHTLSTAGGSFVPGASVFGIGNGTASGGSPRARVATYKVCWPECADADILAAFEAAITDGVDVISVSLGTNTPSEYFESGSSVGSFHAVARGIIVVSSAGNSGPSPTTVSNTEPWVLTVAASTIDRDFASYVTLGDKKIFKGASLSEKSLPAGKLYPLISAADAKSGDVPEQIAVECGEGSLDPKKVTGKIVVCLRGGSSRAGKGAVVAAAGGVGLILANDEASGNALLADPHLLPASAVNYVNGTYILNYIKSAKSPVASISKVTVELGIKPAPVVASFSSRGPGFLEPAILKPDITAPGVNIIAAYSEAASPTSQPSDNRTTPFITMSGTSMSCPHVSGVSGLIKAAHPDWSPAAIKSAIITTATTTDNTGKPILDSTSLAATPFDYGAGHIQPTLALDPGLPYIVYLGSHSFGSSPSAADLESVTNSHYNLLGSYVGSSEKAKESIFYSYNRYINGFAAVLDEDEAANIAKHPNVVSVFLSKERKLHTTHSWDFLGLKRNGVSSLDSPRHPTLGEDIIIANLDTGHGSHTLSTAGGSFVPGANVFGNGKGTASGGSPKARVATYKVCWPECADADILAAFEAAIADGVNVISVSLGSDFSTEYFQSGSSVGAFHAVAHGIIVVSSAGNAGPVASSVTNTEPWVLTVAASTIDRDFASYVTLGNKKIFKGSSLSEGNLPSHKLYPLISAADAKLDHATAEEASPVASISKVTTELGVKPAPVVAAFSSRGPNSLEPAILKPDITAPGVNIIAAYSEAASPTNEPSDKRKTPFLTLSGTSMSCPHVSGVAGLIKAVHPDWSPAAIKSAIITSDDFPTTITRKYFIHSPYTHNVILPEQQTSHWPHSHLSQPLALPPPFPREFFPN
ncbi:hypothetical protein VNO77_24819 [Canavalia gladiata]|uniref:Uncharacterized protein n=1 Tax=Canavalia gladiata TaxID=3824 RepID=A0AAN9QCX2_CANGL